MRWSVEMDGETRVVAHSQRKAACTDQCWFQLQSNVDFIYLVDRIHIHCPQSRYCVYATLAPRCVIQVQRRPGVHITRRHCAAWHHCWVSLKCPSPSTPNGVTRRWQLLNRQPFTGLSCRRPLSSTHTAAFCFIFVYFFNCWPFLGDLSIYLVNYCGAGRQRVAAAAVAKRRRRQWFIGCCILMAMLNMCFYLVSFENVNFAAKGRSAASCTPSQT